jgi:transposase-like protein
MYTPAPARHGYAGETRLAAIRMVLEGKSYGTIVRALEVDPQSVANWANQYTANLPATREEEAEWMA